MTDQYDLLDEAPPVATHPQVTPGYLMSPTGQGPVLYKSPLRTRAPVSENVNPGDYAAVFAVGPGKGLTTDAAARKKLQMWTFLMEYFPDAFLAVLDVSIVGNEQHNKGQPLHWARDKSTDQMNTAFRHMWDYGRGTTKDIDGCYHLAKAIWRLSAQLQLTIEADKATGEVK